jgi:hypothetical protein
MMALREGQAACSSAALSALRASSDIALAQGQHGHRGGGVAVEAFGCHDMRFDKAKERIERSSDAQTDPTASAIVDSATGTPSNT